MRWLETVIVAFSMYTALPMPQVPWNERNLRYALCAFPLAGTVLGGFCQLWVSCCTWLSLPALVQGAGLCAIPVLFTGGIHLDGFADTWDALSSHGDWAKKQAILRDAHIGAFAVLRLCLLFLTRFALWASLERYDGWLFALCFTLSRALSGLSVALFPIHPESSLAGIFARNAHRERVRCVLLALSVLLAVLLGLRGWAGMLAALAAVLVFVRYWLLSRRAFGGLSGDLAGWYLETAECWMLAAVFLARHMEVLL